MKCDLKPKFNVQQMQAAGSMGLGVLIRVVKSSLSTIVPSGGEERKMFSVMS